MYDAVGGFFDTDWHQFHISFDIVIKKVIMDKVNGRDIYD